MAEGPDNVAFAPPLAGKWQIPLLLLAVVAFAAALCLYLLRAPGPDWENSYQHLVQRFEKVSDGKYNDVATEAREMLSETSTPERQGRLYRLLGRIRWRSIEQTANPSDNQWAGLREDYTAALRCSQPRTPDDAAIIAERIAVADAALGDTDKAVERLRRVIRTDAADMDPKVRGRILRRMIELQQGPDGGNPQRALTAMIEYIGVKDLDAEQYGWGVGRAVDLLIADDRLIDAGALIARQEARNLGEPYLQHLHYHRARVLAERGLTEQADNVLINLCRELPIDSKLKVDGELLRGELIWQDNPADSAELFGGVLARTAGTPVATAARLGLAKAYGRMGLTDKSLREYETALRSLQTEGDGALVDLGQVRKSLAAGYRMQMAQQQPLTALRFVELERTLGEQMPQRLTRRGRVDVLGRLAAANRMAVKQVETTILEQDDTDAGRARRRVLAQKRVDLLAAAGDALVKLAELTAATDDTTHGDSLWTAAGLFDQAGDRRRAIDTLEAFIAQHGSDERVPEARFLLGRALQADGRYDDAIEVYRANLEARDPVSRHIKAVEGLIPMAECYVAKGEKHFGEAEKILHSVVAGRDEITPASALYRRALFALGRLYYRQDKWRRARQTLSEAVQRDPGQLVPLGQPDPEGQRSRYVRATRSMYFIAESYQQSAREAMRTAKDAEPREARQLRTNARAQLTQSDMLYRKVIDRLEMLDGELSDVDTVVRRNSYFARGDCMYESGRYEEALDRYRQAVHKFQHRPEALGGLTVMYNCYTEMGRNAEAAACLERAAELAKHLSDPEVDASVHPDVLDEWDRWWQTVEYLDPDISDKGQS